MCPTSVLSQIRRDVYEAWRDRFTNDPDLKQVNTILEKTRHWGERVGIGPQNAQSLVVDLVAEYVFRQSQSEYEKLLKPPHYSSCPDLRKSVDRARADIEMLYERCPFRSNGEIVYDTDLCVQGLRRALETADAALGQEQEEWKTFVKAQVEVGCLIPICGYTKLVLGRKSIPYKSAALLLTAGMRAKPSAQRITADTIRKRFEHTQERAPDLYNQLWMGFLRRLCDTFVNIWGAG